MKFFSILLAWAEDDHEAGEFGWSGFADDYDEAILLARQHAAADSSGYDGDPSGTEWEDFAPSKIVLDSMEGVNMWKANDLADALAQALPALRWAAERWQDAKPALAAAEKALAEARPDAPEIGDNNE